MTSFEVKWKKPDKSIKGKVFARKVKGKATEKSDKVFSVNKKSIDIKKSKKTPFESSEKIPEPNEKQSGKHTQQVLVKRKRKKDKASAKLQQKTGEEQGKYKHHHSLFSETYKGVYVDTNVEGTPIVENLFSFKKKFDDLGIHKYLIANLAKADFTKLTTVQEKSIPVILSGKDVLIRSQTGSGKTLAYAVPILDALVNIEPRINRSSGVQAIIIVPTRELALQVHELFSKINTFQWIVTGHLCGGENRKTEKDRLRKGVHILIATPGRLLDHMMHTAAFNVKNTRCLVLDEADRLLDMGFKDNIVRIAQHLDRVKKEAEYDPLSLLRGEQKPKIHINFEKSQEPTEAAEFPLRNVKSNKRQTLLLSATLTKGITELADFTMKEHIFIDALDDSQNETSEHMVIPNTVTQEYMMTFVKHRLFTLSALIVSKSKKNSKIFVFMATSQMVDFHYELFTNYLLKMPKNRGKVKMGNVVLLDDDDVEDFDGEDEEIVIDTKIFKLHGSMDQQSRKQVFTDFRNAKKGVLLCTDVVARGIDVPTADCIVQYNGPQTDEDYLHRVGRTGRAGKPGEAVIFLTHEEQEFIPRLQNYKVYLKKRESHTYLNVLCDLMEESNQEMACSALQRRYENAVSKNTELYRMACFAFSTWSRFYNTYPSKLRHIFNFKNVNLGHYVTSFALRDSPTTVSRVVRGQVTNRQPKRLNRKLDTHTQISEEEQQKEKPMMSRKHKGPSLTTSEYESGLSPLKKSKQKK